MPASSSNQCSRRTLLLFMIIIVDFNSAEYNKLKMVNVIFRHGERLPTANEYYIAFPNTSHINVTYSQEGLGSLTNNGKLNMYNLGVFLRQRYNNFLGDYYNINMTRIRSTESYRTFLSAQLVNAGLWPPAVIQQWKKDLLWIPVPYEYVKVDEDALMLPYLCRRYKDEYKKVLQSEEVRKLVEPHLEFFAYLSRYSGVNVTTPQQVFFLYHMLKAQTSLNLTLPSWSTGYFPDGQMRDVVILAYDIMNWGDRVKKIYGGPLLREILQNCKSSIKGASIPKMKLYSGHESNIVSILNTLGLWNRQIPDYSSAVIFELYLNNSSNEFGIQILYYRGTSDEIVPLTLTGCTQICPINNFTSLLSNVMPGDFEEVCQMNLQTEDSKNLSESLHTTSSIALLIICILLKPI
ncbi:venom acid phosphatase Acph-1-like [Neodiprion virginianus]|uniref:venom acid phosphatase Acph-1-like n=1 Tax=Neodiprion virginianus TaxID=2961670 RepID=UPI001EE71002|nr:venom acid phosphatase Acph-1-like [Neodiprion virginianus]